MRTTLLLGLFALSCAACSALPQVPQAPQLPSAPGASLGSIPGANAATAGLPSAPAVPGAPGVPGAAGLPTAPGVPGAAALPGAPVAKAAGPSAAPLPTSVEIHSDCTKSVAVFYGDKPKFGSGTKSSIGSNTTTTAPRKADGTLTVWLIDDHENGLANAKVDASTKRVDIDRSCKQISAH